MKSSANNSTTTRELDRAVSEADIQTKFLYRVQSENLTRVTSETLSQEKRQFSNDSDFLENAKVRLAHVPHLKEMFPDLQPLQSPIYESATTCLKNKGTIATTLFAHPGTFCLQEKFYSHLSEL